MNSLSSLIDHTNLRPDALHSDIEILCKEAVQSKFASVCINPVYVSYAKSILKDENPKVCSVVGFPLGADSEEMKYAEARFLIFQGVDEIDMVMNIAFLKERKLDLIKNVKIFTKENQLIFEEILSKLKLNDQFTIEDLNIDSEKKSISDEIYKLKKMYDEGLINEEEFKKAKNKILN